MAKSYYQIIPLAKLILNGCGISISEGELIGTSFLIRTPEIIENGLRSIICDGIPELAVTKKRKILGDSGLSMNPDIVFGEGIAVADIKYKYFSNDWNRNDLNQAVAFATAFECDRCALLGFINNTAGKRPRSVQVGQVNATTLGWPATVEMSPEDAANLVISEVKDWLLQCN